MNDFIKAISNDNNKSIKSYKAYFDIGNNQVGITAEYTKDVLLMIIEEKENQGFKLLKIEKSKIK